MKQILPNLSIFEFWIFNMLISIGKKFALYLKRPIVLYVCDSLSEESMQTFLWHNFSNCLIMQTFANANEECFSRVYFQEHFKTFKLNCSHFCISTAVNFSSLFFIPSSLSSSLSLCTSPSFSLLLLSPSSYHFLSFSLSLPLPPSLFLSSSCILWRLKMNRKHVSPQLRVQNGF